MERSRAVSCNVWRCGRPTMWSMSFRGGTVGMPSNWYSIVAISSNTSAYKIHNGVLQTANLHHITFESAQSPALQTAVHDSCGPVKAVWGT